MTLCTASRRVQISVYKDHAIMTHGIYSTLGWVMCYLFYMYENGAFIRPDHKPKFRRFSDANRT